MKILKKSLCAVLFSALFLFYGTASASIIVVLGTGVDQGSANRIVHKTCDEENCAATVQCLSGGDDKCPTNSEIREYCSGALSIPWIPNTMSDTKVGTIISSWDDGNGTTSGSLYDTVENTTTSEQAIVTYTWITTTSGYLQITITDVLL